MAKSTAHADKRSVSTDALETLGTSGLSENEARDAIHLAVEPVIAGEKLFAGQDIGLVKTASGLVAMATGKVKHLGIVDPFLKAPVFPGDRFWLVVYPRQIKSLRHVWEHPDFPEASAERAPEPVAIVNAPTDKDIAILHIEEFAEKLGYDYEDLMAAAMDYYTNGIYEYDNSESYKGHWDAFPDFWHHWSIVTGKEVRDNSSFFTCSC